MEKRAIAILLTLCMTLSLMPAITLSASAETDPPPDMGLAETELPTGDLSDNPYGGEDWFVLNRVSELIMSSGSPASRLNVSNYEAHEHLKTNTDFIVSSDQSNTFNHADNSNHNALDGVTYASSVAFDNNGDGKRDLVAYIGYDRNRRTPVMWVVDPTNPGEYALSAPEYPAGSGHGMPWMDSINQWEYTNYFSITAGDYDGDGAESVIIYRPAPDVGKSGLVLMEYTYSGGSLTWKQNIELEDILYFPAVPSGSNDTVKRAVPCVQLTSADLDKDGRDELAFTAGFSDLDESSATRGCINRASRLFVYGWNASEGRLVLRNGIELAATSGTMGDDGQHRMRFAGLSAGDVDGDGSDELVVSGYLNDFDKSDGYTGSTMDELDEEKLLVAVVDYASALGYRMGTMTTINVDENCPFFFDGAYTDADAVQAPVPVCCVAAGGKGAAEYVFIAGSIYQYANGQFTHLYTPVEYQETDDAIGGAALSNTWFPQAIAGNFDGNEAGREQVIYLSAYKQTGEEDYWYTTNIIGFAYENDDAANGVYGTVTGYAGVRRGYQLEDADGGPTNRCFLTLAAADVDDDSLMGKIKKKDYEYTDPEILAVLQAPPYWQELEDAFPGYAGNGGTGFGTGKGTAAGISNTVTGTLTAGGVFSYGGEVVDVEISATYTHEWISSYEKELDFSYEYEFAGDSTEDCVILMRTPLMLYTYELKNTKYPADKPTTMTISIPRQPAFNVMHVSQYNTERDKYNKTLAANESYRALPEIGRIDEEKPDSDRPVLVGVSGQPDTYLQSAGVLNTGNLLNITLEDKYALEHDSTFNLTNGFVSAPMELGSAGSISASVTSAISNTEGEAFSNGFNLGVTVQFGSELVKGGGTVEGGAAWEEGAYVTNYESMTRTGCVAPLPNAQIAQDYGMTWQFVTWPVVLQKKAVPATPAEAKLDKSQWTGLVEVQVPVLGYVVNAKTLRQPAVVPPVELEASKTTTNSVTLTWKAPEYRAGDGYNIYRYSTENGKYEKLNTDPVVDAAYTDTGLGSDVTYKYIVRSVKGSAESPEYLSSPVEARTVNSALPTIASHPANVGITPGNTATFSVTAAPYESGTLTYQWQKLDGQDWKDIAGANTDAYVITNADAAHNGTVLRCRVGQVVNGKSRFVYSDSATLTVDETIVMHTVTFAKTGVSPGTVTATVNGLPLASGASVAAGTKVVFKATPALTTYHVASWTADGGAPETVTGGWGTAQTKTVTVNAHTDIKAAFAVNESKITFSTSGSGGTISAASNGIAITSGATVSRPVVFTVALQDGCRVAAWRVNGEKMPGTDDRLELSLSAPKYDVVAEITPQGQFTVTAGVYPANKGTITVNGAAPENGVVSLTQGSPVSVSATPAPYYSLDGYEFSFSGGLADWFAPSSTEPSAPLALLLAGNLNVTAVMTPTAKYAVNYGAKDSTGGAVSATADGESFADGADVPQGAVYVFTASPEAGYSLGGWTVNGTESSKCAENGEVLTINTLDGATAVEAAFVQKLPAPELVKNSDTLTEASDKTAFFKLLNHDGGTYKVYDDKDATAESTSVSAGDVSDGDLLLTFTTAPTATKTLYISTAKDTKTSDRVKVTVYPYVSPSGTEIERVTAEPFRTNLPAGGYVADYARNDRWLIDLSQDLAAGWTVDEMNAAVITIEQCDGTEIVINGSEVTVDGNDSLEPAVVDTTESNIRTVSFTVRSGSETRRCTVYLQTAGPAPSFEDANATVTGVELTLDNNPMHGKMVDLKPAGGDPIRLTYDNGAYYTTQAVKDTPYTLYIDGEVAQYGVNQELTSTVTGGETVHVQYTTVRFYSAGIEETGENMPQVKVPYDKLAVPADPAARPGYKFLGWYVSQSEKLTAETVISDSNITVYALWEGLAEIQIDKTPQTHTAGPAGAGRFEVKVISPADNKPAESTFTVKYQVNGAWTETVPTDAGSYAVEVTRTPDILADDPYKQFSTEISGGYVVEKAPAIAPGEPTVADKTATSLTVDVAPGQVYAVTSGSSNNAPVSAAAWVAPSSGSYIFDGLAPGGSYKIWTKIPETETEKESEPDGVDADTLDDLIEGSLELTGLTVPVGGAAPDTTVDDGAKFTVSSVTWTTSDTTWDPTVDTFAYDTEYTVNVILAAKIGYLFAYPSATLGGKTAELTNQGSDSVTYTAAFTTAPQSKTAAPSFAAQGSRLTDSADLTADFTLNRAYPADTVFAVYSAFSGGVALADISADADGTDFALTFTAAPAKSTVYYISAKTGGELESGRVMVTVTPCTPSKQCSILSFSLAGARGVISGSTISVTVPYGTSLASLTPTVSVSESATLSPAGAQSFASPVTYTVTAEDGVTNNTYSVTVTVAPAPVGGDDPSGGAVTVPIADDTTSVEVEATVDGTTAAVNVDQAALDRIIGSDAASGAVTLDLSALEGGIDTVIIPSAAVKAISDAAVDPGSDVSGLTVKLSGGTVELDAKALSAVSADSAAESISVSLTQVDTAQLPEEQKLLVGDRPVIDVTVLEGVEPLSAIKGARVSVSNPYTPAEGEEPELVTVWYLDENGELEAHECEYKNGALSFVLTHLSEYIIAYFPFRDVAADRWYYGDVAYAYMAELMQGVDVDKFDPAAPTSRAMLVTLLYRMEGEPTVSGANPFDDVEAGKYYEKAVIWAAANKLVEGYDDASFGPDDNITREQMATILYRYADFRGYDVTAASDLSVFTDREELSAWAVPAMRWANASGLITGTDGGALDPQGSAERCQAAAILHRFCERFVKQPASA